MSSSSIRRSAVAGGIAAAMLILATACGSSPSSSTAPSVSFPAESPSQSQSTGGMKAAQDATLGNIVTDSTGMTLYRSDNDKNNPPTSNCTGDCATQWPPVPAVSDSQVVGVDQNLVGSVERADGTKQLTLGGWPLYRYAGDKQAGDTKGQKVGEVWFASTPDGLKAGESSDASASPTNSSGY